MGAPKWRPVNMRRFPFYKGVISFVITLIWGVGSPLVTPKQRGMESSCQSVKSLNSLNVNWHIFEEMVLAKKGFITNLRQPHHLTSWDSDSSWGCIEWCSGERWEVRVERWEVRGERWEVRGERWQGTGGRWRVTSDKWHTKWEGGRIDFWYGCWSVLLSTHIERVSVSRLQDFFVSKINWIL